MKFLPVSVALILSAAAGTVTTGAALSPPAPPETDLRLVPVGGCHADLRTHFVPEFGETVRHYHRGNCRPVLADRSSDDRPVDCHRDVRTHRIGGVMLRHRHVGKDCRVREVRQSN